MEKLKLNIQKFASGSMQFSNGNMACLLNWSSSVIGSTPAEKAQNNKSNVSATVYVRRTDGYSTWGNFTGHININGSLVGFDTYASVSGDWVALGSATIQVGHNTDGSKVCYVGGLVTGPTETSWEGKTASGGQNVTLDTIARMSRLNSVSFELDLQNRENNIESNFSASYTRYNNEFTDDLVIEYSTDNTNWSSLKTINNYTSGNSLSFTTQEKNTLYNAFTNSNDVNLKYYLKTYSGQTLIGNSSALNIIGKIYDANPTFSGVSFEDTNNTTLALTGNNQIIVKGYSNATITIPVATGNKGATIVDYVIEGVDNPISHTGSQLTYTINNCNIGIFNVYARDSRGNTTLSTVIASSIKSYENIYLNVQESKIERWENDSESATGDEAKLTLNGTIWNNNFGSVNNSITSSSYELKITDSSGSPIVGTTDITPTINQDGTITFTDLIRSDNPDYSWNLEDSYYIYITVADRLSSYTITLTLNSAIPTMSLSKKGVGVMCAYDETKGGLLQIGGEPYAMGDTLPIDTVVEYEGSTVPDGFELIEDYSLNEIKTNKVWINSKPIYRKVVISNNPSGTFIQIPHSISNIDEIFLVGGYALIGNTYRPLASLYMPDLSNNGSGIYHIDSNNINYSCSSYWSTMISKIVIILEYTKTTD